MAGRWQGESATAVRRSGLPYEVHANRKSRGGTRAIGRCLNKSIDGRVGSLVILMQHVALNGGNRAYVLYRRCARLVVAWRCSLAIMFAVATAACALGRSASVRDLVNVSTPLTDNEVILTLFSVQPRAAIAGKYGRLTSAADEAAGRPGTEFAIGSNGRLQFVRSSGAIQGGTVSGDGTSTTWTRELCHPLRIHHRHAGARVRWHSTNWAVGSRV